MKTNENEWNDLSGGPDSSGPGGSNGQGAGQQERNPGTDTGSGRPYQNGETESPADDDDDLFEEEGMGNDYADDPDADDLNDDSDATV